jgi:hypothetical protein
MATQPDVAVSLPCIELDPLGSLPSIPLLGGATINAFVDVAGSPPTDCRLNFNLLIQLGPLFASMACLFKILDVISKLKDFVSAVPSLDPIKIGKAVPDLVSSITALSTCIPALQIPTLVIMLKHIILLILSFIDCVLEQIDSVLKFKLSLNFDAAQGNPTLTQALQCASNSADAALGNTMASLQPLQALMTIIGIIGSLAGHSLALPDFSSMSTDVSQVESTVSTLKNAVDSLKSIVQALPG